MGSIKLLPVLAMASMLIIDAQSSAHADGFRAKVGISSAAYSSLDQISNNELKINYQTLNLGGSYIWSGSGIFVDFTNRSTIGDAHWNLNELSNGLFADESAKRTDNTLTVGKILGQYQVFAGYQAAETILDLPVGCACGPDETLLISGFFVGAGTGFTLGGGMMSLSAAVGMMSAKWTYTDGTPTDNYSAGPGYSLGLSYSYPLNEKLALAGELKSQSFKPKDYGANDTITSLGVNVVASF